MHSSRMRTARLLTVSRSICMCWEGVCLICVYVGGLPSDGVGLPSHGIVGMQTLL